MNDASRPRRRVMWKGWMMRISPAVAFTFTLSVKELQGRYRSFMHASISPFVLILYMRFRKLAEERMKQACYRRAWVV